MGFTGLSLCSPNLMLLRAAEATARGVMLESLDAVRMRRPLLVEKALKDDTLLAFGMNGGLLTPDHGFPLRAVVSGWAAVASVKWLGRIFVSKTPLFSPWNTASMC